MSQRRCFVLREVPILMRDLKKGDIFILEGDALCPVEYMVALADGREDGRGLAMVDSEFLSKCDPARAKRIS